MIANAALSQDPDSELRKFRDEGKPLTTVGRAAVEPVTELLKEGKHKDAKQVWKVLKELGA